MWRNDVQFIYEQSTFIILTIVYKYFALITQKKGYCRESNFFFPRKRVYSIVLIYIDKCVATFHISCFSLFNLILSNGGL